MCDSVFKMITGWVPKTIEIFKLNKDFNVANVSFTCKLNIRHDALFVGNFQSLPLNFLFLVIIQTKTKHQYR